MNFEVRLIWILGSYAQWCIRTLLGGLYDLNIILAKFGSINCLVFFSQATDLD